MKNMQYVAIYAKTRTGFSAHIPDLPGCIATGKTLTQTQKRLQEAVALHIEGMREDGIEVPQPTVVAGTVEVNAA